MKPCHSQQRLVPGALAVLGAALLALAGCASGAGIAPVITAMEPAQLGLPAGHDAPSPVDAALDAQWWRTWNDPALSDLMTRALAAHPSLQVAQARLAKSAAAVAGEEGGAGPKLSASADTMRQHFSANSVYPPPLGGATQTLANAQLSGNWELDFFGRHRASIDAAVGAQRAAEADMAAARNLLSSQLAQTYVQLARLKAQRELAERALAQREQMLGLIRQRVEAGLDSRIELNQGEGALPESRLQIEQIDEQMGATRNALAALAGVPAQSLASLRPALPRPVAGGLPEQLPADLLGRRADITAARWRIEAATHGVKATKAQFYPNVNLSAFAGFSSIGLNQLIETGSRQMGIGPAIRLPIFDAGSLRANLSGKTADLDGAVAVYNGAVLEAVRETADQLNTLQSLARQQAEQTQAQNAAESAFRFAEQRYGAGLSAYLSLLHAEGAVLAQRRQAVDLQARSLTAQLGLIRAIGGGYGRDNSRSAQPLAQASPR